MGGWIAHGTALFRPEIVNKLILISPAAGIPEKTTWGKYLISLIFNGSEKNVKRVISDILGPFQAGDDWFEYMFYATADPKSVKMAFPKTFKDEEFKLADIPTLLLVGDNEIIYKSTEDVFERAEIFFPDIQTVIIPEAGHLGYYDNPVFVNNAVISFLKN